MGHVRSLPEAGASNMSRVTYNVVGHVAGHFATLQRHVILCCASCCGTFFSFYIPLHLCSLPVTNNKGYVNKENINYVSFTELYFHTLSETLDIMGFGLDLNNIFFLTTALTL